jgi:hypothetical protein
MAESQSMTTSEVVVAGLTTEGEQVAGRLLFSW